MLIAIFYYVNKKLRSLIVFLTFMLFIDLYYVEKTKINNSMYK